jgi:hypothetical protein
MCTTPDGEPATPHTRLLVAANPTVHDRLRRIVREHHRPD